MPPVLEIQRLALDRFRGDWRVHRRVTPGGSFLGSARFDTLELDQLSFVELGVHTFERIHAEQSPAQAQRTLTASRAGVLRVERGATSTPPALVWLRRHPTLGLVELHRLSFEKVDDDALWARHTHECADDRYDLSVCVGDDELTMDYVVNGPAKSYRSHASYRRV